MRRDRPLIWRRPSWKPWPAKQKTSIRNIRGSILDLIWLDDFVDDSWVVWIFPKRVSLWCSVMFRCYCLIYYNKKRNAKNGDEFCGSIETVPPYPRGESDGPLQIQGHGKTSSATWFSSWTPWGGFMVFFGGGIFWHLSRMLSLFSLVNFLLRLVTKACPAVFPIDLWFQMAVGQSWFQDTMAKLY